MLNTETETLLIAEAAGGYHGSEIERIKSETTLERTATEQANQATAQNIHRTKRMEKEILRLKDQCRRLRTEAAHRRESVSAIEATSIRDLTTDEIEQTYDPAAPEDDNIAKIEAKIMVLEEDLAKLPSFNDDFAGPGGGGSTGPLLEHRRVHPSVLQHVPVRDTRDDEVYKLRDRPRRDMRGPNAQFGPRPTNMTAR